MSSIIKSVSLDPEAAARAKRIPNFSRFVRECLRRHDQAMNPDDPFSSCRTEGDELCNPLTPDSQGGRCMYCWPAGPPPKADWSAYLYQSELSETLIHKYDSNDGTGTRHLDFRVGDEYQVITREAHPHYQDREWILQRARDTNPTLFDFEDMVIVGNAKPKSKPKRRSLIRRALRFLRL
jgi:glutaredoxin